MSERNFRQLVRDGVPDRLESQGIKIKTRKLKGQEFLMEVRDELVVAAQKVADSKTKSEIIDHMAELNEIGQTLVLLVGGSPEDVDALQEKKRIEFGGYDNRIILESNQ